MNSRKESGENCDRFAMQSVISACLKKFVRCVLQRRGYNDFDYEQEHGQK